MSGFFHLSLEVQNLIYAMNHAAQWGASPADRAFASQMVTLSFNPRWEPSAGDVHRMRLIACQPLGRVSA